MRARPTPRPRQSGSTQSRFTSPTACHRGRRAAPHHRRDRGERRCGPRGRHPRGDRTWRASGPTRWGRGTRIAPRALPRHRRPPSAGRRRRQAPAPARCRDGMAKVGRCIPSILSETAGAPVPRAARHVLPVFSPVPPDIDFVALEQVELDRWAAHRVFERSIEQREGAPPWVFYEGPPTANGMPGLHHVWARVYKDLFCRFRTMAGSYVARRAGWDTHGLPVEVEVEKRLGITGQAADRGAGRHRRVHPLVPRVGLFLCRRVRPLDHADRLLGRHGRGLLDAQPVVHRVSVVAPPAAVRPGAALRGPQSRPLLPPLWHGPFEPRTRASRRLP